MSLPKVTYPLTPFTIPSLKKSVLFRPFVAKEEKILLMAKQDGLQSSILLTIKQVVNNCCQDDTININDLTVVDVEYLFVKLRGISIDNVIKDVTYEDSTDGTEYKFDIDVGNIEVVEDPNFSNKIMINESLGMVMKPLTVADAEKFEVYDDVLSLTTDLIRLSIDSVFDDDNVHKFSDETVEEQLEFLDMLDSDVYKSIKAYFQSLPKLRHVLEYVNKEGAKKEIVLDKLTDFFTFR